MTSALAVNCLLFWVITFTSAIRVAGIPWELPRFSRSSMVLRKIPSFPSSCGPADGNDGILRRTMKLRENRGSSPWDPRSLDTDPQSTKPQSLNRRSQHPSHHRSIHPIGLGYSTAPVPTQELNPIGLGTQQHPPPITQHIYGLGLCG